MITVRTITSIYGPLPVDEDGDPLGDCDFPLIDQSIVDHTFDPDEFDIEDGHTDVSLAAEYVATTATEASESPEISHRTWWIVETYNHPYRDEREEVSHHVQGDEETVMTVNNAILEKLRAQSWFTG